LVLIGSLSLITSCSKVLPSLLGGSGPNVAANTQIGRTNTQTIGTTNNAEQKLVRPKARTIRQEQTTTKVAADEVQTVVVNEVPAWVILLLILGWLFPSPSEIGRKLTSLVRKGNK